MMASKGFDAFFQIASGENIAAERMLQNSLLQLEQLEKALFDANGRKLITYERLQELVEADADGRVVTMPCHLGEEMHRVYMTPQENKKPSISVRKIVFGENNFFRIMFDGEFGATVFLKKQEADKVAAKLKKKYGVKK